MTRAAGPIGLAGWSRIVLRSLGVAVWLLGCLALYPLGMPLRGRNPVPRWFFAGALRLVGARLAVSGERVSRDSILIANHVSWIDILALASATGTAFVAHEGLADHPVMRFLCRLNRTVFIARNERSSVTGQVAQLREALRESKALTLFPEGTTGDGVALLPFKSSLLAAIDGGEETVAIRPVWIDYGARSSQIAWLGDEPGLDNVKRVLARSKPVVVAVHLLPPLEGEQRKDRKAIAASARDAIAARAAQRVAL